MSKAKEDTTVVIALSGGVDSAVAALLLKQQGYRVIGMFMKNWNEEDESGCCTWEKDYQDVIHVCDVLDIPYYTVDFSKEYWDRVFSRVLEDFKAGHTPNPDVLCNKEIKFKALLDKALEIGGDYLATGHYCRNMVVDGKHCLVKGLDDNKDQSYFLYTIKEEILQKVLFPIGGMVKEQVRLLATEHDLAVADKKDSTGICFIGERNFKEFLTNYIEPTPGNFENVKGEVVGRHDGTAFYTIGQRRGLKIGGQGEAWFVIDKDVERNVVVIDQGHNHPALYRQKLVAKDASWVGDVPQVPCQCSAKIRYRQRDEACTIEKIEGDQVFVTFDVPQRAVTKRQSIVFYDGDICLGGAIIH